MTGRSSYVSRLGMGIGLVGDEKVNESKVSIGTMSECGEGAV